MSTTIIVTAGSGSDGPGSVSFGFHSASYGSTSPNPPLLTALTISRILTSEVNPSQAYFVVAIVGATSQSMFSSVNIQIGNPGTPPGITLNSAAAVFVNTGGTATWTWDTTTTAIMGGTGPYTVTFNVDTPPSIALATPVDDGSIVELSWTPTVGTGADVGTFGTYSVSRNGVTIATGLTATQYNDISIMTETSATYVVKGTYSLLSFSPVVSNSQTICVDTYNFNCDVVSPYDTLLNLRNRMLIRLGYPNQVNNPPAGMTTLLNEFLADAQRIIYRQVQRAALRTERFFRWTMVPGQRYYGIAGNNNCCTVVLDPEKVVWVGFQDLNSAWYSLDEGIPPEYYTRANINFGWPTRYEIRQGIEIFPAPQAAYILWVKGDFGLAPLVGDTDRTTIDDEAVFLLALGNAKTHYGQKDAQAVMSQAGNYIKGVVAGTHGTRRYVPRTRPENPWTPPKFLPLGDGQA